MPPGASFVMNPHPLADCKGSCPVEPPDAPLWRVVGFWALKLTFLRAAATGGAGVRAQARADIPHGGGRPASGLPRPEVLLSLRVLLEVPPPHLFSAHALALLCAVRRPLS